MREPSKMTKLLQKRLRNVYINMKWVEEKEEGRERQGSV
jgi:hypothetical protein